MWPLLSDPRSIYQTIVWSWLIFSFGPLGGKCEHIQKGCERKSWSSKHKSKWKRQKKYKSEQITIHLDKTNKIMLTNMIFWLLRDDNRPQHNVGCGVLLDKTICSRLGRVGPMLSPSLATSPILQRFRKRGRTLDSRANIAPPKRKFNSYCNCLRLMRAHKKTSHSVPSVWAAYIEL